MRRSGDDPPVSGIAIDDAGQAVGMSAIEAVTGRQSVRRFLGKEIAEEMVLEILQGAARAPSGQNMQPWQVHYVTGETRSRLCQEVAAAAEADQRHDEYAYFPERVEEPFISRRRKVGFDLLATYGIERHDLAGRKRALLANFEFFGAPVGLFFTMRRDWGLGAWLDTGNYMTNVMTLARAYGLESCAQQAWAEYGPAVRRVLPIAADHVLVSGMALGYEDKAAAVNTLVTQREPLDSFVVRHR